jgi:ribonuclease HI
LKKYLTTPPTLVGPEPHENLQLYILAMSNVVSTAIVIERGESDTNRKIQYLVYFVSEVLSDSKSWNFPIMKLTYALLIEAQALSDFVAEWTEIQTPPKERELEYWTINFDGSVQLQGAGAGILVTSPKGESFKYVLQIHFPASNNAAKYQALLHGLRIAMALGIRRLRVLDDSMLNINQANKEWSCLDDNMLLYCQELCKLENNFDGLEYLHILRGKNEVVNELAKLGSSRAMVSTWVFSQKLHEPTISKALAKANKVAKSSQEISPPPDDITESTEVMEIHSD